MGSFFIKFDNAGVFRSTPETKETNHLKFVFFLRRRQGRQSWVADLSQYVDTISMKSTVLHAVPTHRYFIPVLQEICHPMYTILVRSLKWFIALVVA